MAAPHKLRPFPLGRLLVSYRFTLLGVSLAGALLGFLLSFAQSPSFSATALVYAAGGEEDMRLHQGNTLILQQLFQSSYLRDTLIGQHQLQKHYGIPPEAAQAQAKTYRALENHLSIKRTVFNALEINATDPDPRFAARLANSAARLISAANDQLIRENKSQRLAIMQARLKNRQEAFDSLLLRWKRSLRRNKRDSLQVLQAAAERLEQEKKQRLNQRDVLIQEMGYLQPQKQLSDLLQKIKELEQKEVSLMARKKAARADTTRQRLSRLIAGTNSKRSYLQKEVRSLQEDLPAYRSLQNELKRLQAQLNQNRTLQNQLSRKSQGMLSQELKREQVKKAFAELEERRKKLRQGKERLAHPPRVAYQASKAIPPAEPSRPLRILWALLGAVVLSSSALLYYTLYHLWKGTRA